MKKILLFASIIACLCACQTEVTTPIYTYSVTAYAEAETRTALDAEDHVVWKTGDQLALVMGSAVATFTLDANQDGQRYGTFSYTGSQLADGTYMAYYPASVVADDGTFTWPTMQVYSADQCKNAPMQATGISVSGNALGELRFTNMGGLLQLTLSGNETVQEVAFHGKKGSTPVVITLTGCNHSPAPTHYYLALEAGKYTDVYFTITDANGYVAIKNSKRSVTITQNRILEMTLPTLTFDIVPITANGQTVYFAKNNYGASSPTDLGTSVTWTSLPAANGHWRVPTAEEMEVLFHWAKTTDSSNNWTGSTPNPDYTWGWTSPCVTVTSTTGAVLQLPTQIEPAIGYYWSSSADGDNYAWMFSVVYDTDISTSESSTPRSSEAYVRLIYDPSPLQSN